MDSYFVTASGRFKSTIRRVFGFQCTVIDEIHFEFLNIIENIVCDHIDEVNVNEMTFDPVQG